MIRRSRLRSCRVSRASSTRGHHRQYGARRRRGSPHCCSAPGRRGATTPTLTLTLTLTLTPTLTPTLTLALALTKAGLPEKPKGEEAKPAEEPKARAA